GGVQRNVVTRPAPEESRSREQVVYLEAALGGEAQGPQVQLQPPGLGVVRVEIDDDEHGVTHGRASATATAVLEAARFAVGDEILIVDVMELQTPVALQGCVFSADAIDACNQLLQTVVPNAVPEPHLVLLRIEVFLAPGLARPVLEQLER